MKNFEKPGKWKRHILPVLLLAAACVGTVELVVCAYQAPDIYAAITAPVRSLAHHAGQAGELVWAGLQQHTDRVVAEGVTHLQTGLRKLDDYLSRPPEPEPELTPELQEELQLVDDDTDLAPPPRSRADYSVTALLSRDGQQYLTGGSHNLIYYDQTASRWAEEPYGSDTIGRYGCGPTVMAMVVSTLTQTSIRRNDRSGLPFQSNRRVLSLLFILRIETIENQTDFPAGIRMSHFVFLSLFPV